MSLHYRDIMMEIFNFLAELKHKKAIEFEQYLAKITKLEEKYIRLHGKEFMYEISVNQIIELLKLEKRWEFKILYLTHVFDRESKKIKSRLEIDEKRNASFSDIISSNVKINYFFSRSHQKYLNCEIFVGTAVVMNMFTDNALIEEYYKWYDAILNYICNRLEYKENDLYNDFGLLYQMIYNLFYRQGSIDNKIESALSYGPCMFICSLTEKLLRIVYKYEKQKEEYINIDKYTLGELLSENNDVIVKILGHIQVKHLRYFFLTDPDGKVGLAYRNRLAHWRDFAPSDLNRGFVCKLFFLFMNVVNSIFVYYIQDQKDVNF